MRVTVKYIIYLWFVMMSSIYSMENPWEGQWYVFSQEGTYILHLEQNGIDVRGTYQPSNVAIEGKVENHILHAKSFDDNNKSNIISLTMGETQNTFFGNELISGIWIAGTRVNEDRELSIFQFNSTNPSNALYSFLSVGNSIRSGNKYGLQNAIELLEFTDEQKKLRHANRLDVINIFYQILDECIINKRLFDDVGDKEKNSILIGQIGSDVKIPINFVQDQKTKLWKIKVPELDILQNQLKSLLEAKGKYEVDPKDDLELNHPRATMRTFFEQYDRWNNGGKKYVISTMNLSDIDPAIHEWQAPLFAYYLKSVLDRISHVIYQEIPNDFKSKKPYVHFHHPIGSIIIEPYVLEDKTVWQFTPQTLENISKLYYEMYHVKSHVTTQLLEENDLYFSLKRIAQNISPYLIYKIHNTELWQIFMLLFIIVCTIIIVLFIKSLTLKIFKPYILSNLWTEEMIVLRYLRPIQLIIFGILLLYGTHQLRLSNYLFNIIKGFSLFIIVVGSTWVIYNLITIVFVKLKDKASKTSTDVDEIIFSLLESIFRVVVITGAIFIIAEIFNIPYQTVLTGLGIGGLAFAIAAKDTISNFFGSAIIVADRPFQTGDTIKIGSDIGKIINVGIRSTTIRTKQDTVLTVPNNKITHEMIDNFTKREFYRFETEFYFDLDTTTKILNELDKDIKDYLESCSYVNKNKLLLTGVKDYTRKGILYQIVCFMNAKTLEEYTTYRHNIITKFAEIIKRHKVKLNSIENEYVDISDD